MKITILLVMVAVVVFGSEMDPLSDEFIDYINSNQDTWTAGRNFDAKTTMEDIKYLLGALEADPELDNFKTVFHTEPADIPESFDAREQWPECKEVIGAIADQAACGNCWAVSAASAMSDRRCIASKGKEQTPVSAIDVTSCCRECGFGCIGGYSHLALDYWYKNGIVTGGLYQSGEGCKPFPFQPCDHTDTGTLPSCDNFTYYEPNCAYQCDDPSRSYNDSLTFAESEPVSFVEVESIQREIMKSGTVVVGFIVYADFPNYKNGIYQHITGDRLGLHDVRIIGWGVENDVPYWLVPNSWNDQWGENGYFRILRGTNESGIETKAYSAPPKF